MGTGLMAVKPSKVSNREPGDKLLRKLADDLLTGGIITVETIEARYKHWSADAWRRLTDIHRQAYEEKHGRPLFEVKK